MQYACSSSGIWWADIYLVTVRSSTTFCCVYELSLVVVRGRHKNTHPENSSECPLAFFVLVSIENMCWRSRCSRSKHFSALHGAGSADEIGHNMGAGHDRVNTGLTWTEYGHGLRYCSNDGNAR